MFFVFVLFFVCLEEENVWADFVDLTRVMILVKILNAYLLMTEFDRPDMTLYGWQDVKIQLLNNVNIPVACLEQWVGF